MNLLLFTLVLAGQDDRLREDAVDALRRATTFFHQEIAVQGGYVWRVSEDLRFREGEGGVDTSKVWVQPPGTPAIGLAFLEAYEATRDEVHLKAARDAGAVMLRGQLRSGGWISHIPFSPKDRTVLEQIEPCFEIPGEFVSGPPGIGPEECNQNLFASYCSSPAALFSPQVFSFNRQTELYWTPPWELPSGFRTPSMGQIKFPTLKTHMLEYRWLQNVPVACNTSFSGCEPYFFNHGFQSVPVTLFYDASVRMMGVMEAMSSDRRQIRQTGGEEDGVGLWSRDTTFLEEGFFIPEAYDFVETSYHILTIEGARGRDTVGKE